jgi:hypothetical protein
MSFDIALADFRKFGTVILLLRKGASIMRELVVLSTSTVRGGRLEPVVLRNRLVVFRQQTGSEWPFRLAPIRPEWRVSALR